MSEALVESRSVYVEVILSSWCLDVGLKDNTASCSIKNNLDANCNSSNTTNLGLKLIFSCNFRLVCQAAGTGPAEESEQKEGEECLVIKIMSD